jgi:hypothetical protein
VQAVRAEWNVRYREIVADSIRRLQRRRMADTRLDPMVAAAALGAMSSRFAETWLVEKSIDCTMDMLRDAGVPEEDLEAALLAVATYTWGQLLLDALGREALSVESRGSSRRASAPTAPGPTFAASFEFLLDGVRSRGRATHDQS